MGFLLFLFTTLLALTVSTNAFLVTPHSARTTGVSSIRLVEDHLSEVDELCVENAARYCLENNLATSECDLDEYEALVATLQQQREYHLRHVHTLNGLLTKLPNVNQGPIQHKHLNERDEQFVEDAATYLLENTDAPVVDKQEMETMVTTLQEQDQFHMEHLETINDLLARLLTGENHNFHP
jgi:hypothetical protein